MSLQRKAVGGALLAYADIVLLTLINVIFLLWMARLLTSEDFGIIAYATVFIFIGNLLVDVGLSTALIQREKVSQQHIDSAFVANVSIGFVFMALLYFFSHEISSLLGEERLVPILEVLSIRFLFAGITAVPVALLTRQLSFKKLVVINSLSSLIAAATGIYAGEQGAGIWSLVIFQVLSTFLIMIGTYLCAWKSIGIKAAIQPLRELLGFSGAVLMSQIVMVTSQRGVVFLIGAFYGVSTLGLYTVGDKFRIDLNTVLNSILNKVVMPILSKMQREISRLEKALSKVNTVRGVTNLPIYLGFSAIAPDFISVALGSGWELSGTILTVMLWLGLTNTINGAGISALTAIGRPGVVFYLNLGQAIGILLTLYILRQESIVVAAMGIVSFSMLYTPLRLYVFQRITGVSINSYLKPFLAPLLSTFLMYFSLKGLQTLPICEQPLISLLLSIPVGALIYLASIRLFGPNEFMLVTGLLTDLKGKKLNQISTK